MVAANFGRDPLEQGRLPREIGAPHVAAIDDACGENTSLRPGLQQRIELLRRAHQIDVQPMDRQCHRGREIVIQPSEVGGQEQSRCAGSLRQLSIRTLERGSFGARPIQREHRFIQLNPGGARGRQRAEDLRVDGQQRIEQ